jgi:crotonobetainyl-CoA:carnitine CoA-transferase CaiB-like acyl-CoA transferase
MTGMTSGPLAGVRVIDLTTVLMGPFATQILGDFGADVIKVEPPGGGDGVRGVGPRRHLGMAAIFLHANRSKRSIVLDLKHPAGREALLRLAVDADVLIYNVRPQAMARLGLSYEDLAAVNPRIIYVGTYGYGQRGPYAAKPAYDDLIQGAVGIPALSVLAGGDKPRYAPSPLADRICGLAAVNAVTAALFWRERTGEGQSVEVPMFETMAQFTLSDHMCGETFEPPLGPTGYARVLNEHRRPYATRDGYLCVLPYSDKQWQTFFRVVGRPELLEWDPRFSSLEKRTEHIRELYSLLAEIMLTRTTADWRERLEAADIPVMPMHSIDTLMEDPHLMAVGFLETVEHPTEGRMRSIGIPSSWSKSQPRVTRHAPRAGEHGRQVLSEAGYDARDIDALVSSGAMSLPDDC